MKGFNRQEKTESKFNSGIAYLELIDKLDNYAHGVALKNDNSSYFDVLNQLNVAIDQRMRKEHRDEVRKIKLKCIEVMNKNINLNNENQAHYKVKTILQVYHKVLGRIQDDLGLRMINKEDESLALK